MEPKTVDYTPELFADVTANMLDYMQTGWTVCGAEDPAVITISREFGELHPDLKGYSVVRVIDRYVNSNKSATLLEFSNKEMTDAEYSQYDEITGE